MQKCRNEEMQRYLEQFWNLTIYNNNKLQKTDYTIIHMQYFSNKLLQNYGEQIKI